MPKKRPQQLNRKQTAEQLKKFVSEVRYLNNKVFTPGQLLIYRYNAKYKEKIYDKRPMVLVLRSNKKHMLGLNFHWIPFAMRMWLVRYIIKENKANIKNGEKLVFPYKKIRPLLKKICAPCIRLYLHRGISPKGVVLPPEHLIEAAQLRMEMFTGVPEDKLWKKKKQQSKRG